MIVECPICMRDITIDENAVEGDIVKCPVCKESFRLVRVNGEWEGERI
jgi:predicted Zn finger-like uncharacterized protein